MNTTEEHDRLCLIHRCPGKDNLFEWLHTPPGDYCHYCGTQYKDLWIRLAAGDKDVLFCNHLVDPEHVTKFQEANISEHL